jgi:hypothetical protein
MVRHEKCIVLRIVTVEPAEDVIMPLLVQRVLIPQGSLLSALNEATCHREHGVSPRWLADTKSQVAN